MAQARLCWLVLVLTALCTLLLAIRIERPAYWVDEKISVDIADANTIPEILVNAIARERRPPLYHVGLWAWEQFIGRTERAARLYSALWAILLVPVAFRLARRLAGKHAAVLAAGAVASSPLLVSYGQTARYYTMVATLSALSYVLFWELVRRPRARKTWLVYMLVTLMLLYTDYPAYAVVVAQNVLVLAWWFIPRRQMPPPPRRRWIAAQLTLVALAAVWIPVVLDQQARDFGAADLSHTPAGILLKVGYPFYAWTVGEALFPWNPLAVVGVGVYALLLLRGLVLLKQAKARFFWLAAFSVPFAVSQLLLELVAPDSPFVNAPARTMACFALLNVVLGVGLASLNRRWLSLTLVVLAATRLVTLFNYYTGTAFINPIYNTPARDIAQAIQIQAQAGDIVVSESDSIVISYLPEPYRVTHFFPQQVSEIQSYLADHPQASVWQVSMGRDRTYTKVSANLSNWLKTQRRLCSSTGFAEQDPTYRKIKSWLLKREAYRYRLTLDEYCP